MDMGPLDGEVESHLAYDREREDVSIYEFSIGTGTLEERKNGILI